ncbi:MAG: HAMP domain-containing sensor histidine kinase [Bacteroidota bacterium]
MNQPTINRNARKPISYPLPANQYMSLTPPKVVEEHPGQFAAALAHEVRNPLSNINLAVEMLKSTLSDDDQKIYLDIIMRASGRINDVVTDLLAYYQAVEIKSEKHSIHQLLDEVLAMTSDRIMLKNIIVAKDYTPMDCTIWVNKQKMKIALTNIIINAIDAMRPEKGKLKLVTRSVKDKYIIEIEDNGIGISKENLKNIFKPYFTNKPCGMGLGLSTTLDILLSSHAGVAVQSEEGRGTRFILSFDNIQPSGKYFYEKPVPVLAHQFQ